MLLKDIVLIALLSFAVRLGTAQEVSLCKGDGTFLETSNVPGAKSTCKSSAQILFVLVWYVDGRC